MNARDLVENLVRDPLAAPAIRLLRGRREIFTGGNHGIAAEAAVDAGKLTWEEVEQEVDSDDAKFFVAGYVTKSGRFLNRQQAANFLGYSEVDDKRTELDSEILFTKAGSVRREFTT